ncbi:MAG: hypothetical protein ACLR3C_17640 [Eggerthella lenta]
MSFSVAASFLAAVPLCAIQGSWLAEWSFDLSSLHGSWRPWRLTLVCALLNAYFLAALPVDRERMAPAAHGDGNDRRWAFGLLCAVFDGFVSHGNGVDGWAHVRGRRTLACLFWYATARSTKSAASPGRRL